MLEPLDKVLTILVFLIALIILMEFCLNFIFRRIFEEEKESCPRCGSFEKSLKVSKNCQEETDCTNSKNVYFCHNCFKTWEAIAQKPKNQQRRN